MGGLRSDAHEAETYLADKQPKPLKVAVICKRYYTNKDLLQDRFGRLYHIPVELSRLGCQVSVFALDYRNTAVREEQEEGVTFKTVPSGFTSISRMPFAVYFLSKAKSPDIIIASGDSHIGYIGLLIARLLGAKFVFDVYDYYPSFRGNRIPGFKAMFRKAVATADLVLCASRPLIERLSGLNSERLLIENGVDRSLFKPQDMLVARADLEISSDSIVIGYFGSINKDRGPLLIRACEMLQEEYPNLCLLMAGKVDCVDLHKPWIRYLGELPQCAIPALVAACDVVTVPYANDPFNSMTGACKIAEYLACGKPVVATRVAGHKAMFRDSPVSLCEPNDQEMQGALKIQLELRQVEAFPESLEWRNIAQLLWGRLKRLREESVQ